MKTIRRSTCVVALVAVLLNLHLAGIGLANQVDTPPIAELSDEEVQQVQATERFLKVLEKSPRRGTALDRVYGHHVEFGTLDKFLQQLNDRVTKDPKDTEAWMLLGLFESQRGGDASAVDAFQKAAALRPTDPLSSYYLGQSLLRIGQTSEAVEAFEQALTRKPARADLLEIFQQLGRVHQRSQRTEEAMKVWQRLETLFPDDPRVLEQIAVTLAEEGAPALALPRYQRLAELVKDDYRRVLFRVAAAGLKVKTNHRDEGIADMEAVLTDLNPDSWLYRDVRRRIEEVFLKSGDQDNLVKYYQNWLSSHVDDVEAMTRLAKFLASSARMPEAKEWMEKALKLAPSRTDLRKAFIDQLVDEQQIPDAIKQYEQLVASSPSNPDYLRDWGKLVLKDKSQELDVRKKEATRIWNQVIAIRPDDASNLAQVADFFRQANLNDEAIELYQKAIEKSPNDPQYREYLGEFFHIQKRTDEALTIWKSIAEAERRNAVNVTRLAEVYNSFGYHDQAVQEIADACRLDPKDFSLQIRGAEYHMRSNRFDEALAYVDAAEKLSGNDDERDMVVRQRIEVLQSSQRLDGEIEKLAASVRDNSSAKAEQWHLLARYQEAGRQWVPAAESIDTALKLDAKSIPILTTAARIAEASGDFGRAAEFNRKLAAVDRRSLGDHLMNVARLEAQLGRSDEALKAAQDLIVSAPGNTDNYEFMAKMCFRFGKQAEGLESLRKAVRINPNEPHLIMALGAALADQLRTDEAIEVYWRAFGKTDDLDDKTSLTLKLTPLYQQINQFDKLIERFERDRREEEKRREMTICLAQAHNAAGDYGTARYEMESLLSQDTRDTNLLQQLAKLCEGGQDLEAAIGYQRQLVAIAPGAETELPLAKMLQTRGDRDEAADILVRITQREEDPVRLLKSLDSLLTNSNMESVLKITEPLLSQQRDDWELIYREGVAWALFNKHDEAKVRFERLLALNFPHDKLGASAEAKHKQALSKAKSDNLRGVTTQQPSRKSPLDSLQLSNLVQQAVGLSNERYYSGSSGPKPVWMPEVYGVARMAAYGWLMKFDEDSASTIASTSDAAEKKAENSIFEELSKSASEASASSDVIYDSLYVATLKSKHDEIFKMARQLAKEGGKRAQQYFLQSLTTRSVQINQQQTSNSNQVAPKKNPLDDDDLALMLKCYQTLSEDKSTDMSAAAASGGQIAYGSAGQVYINVGGSLVLLSGAHGGGGTYLGVVTEELQLAGRDKQANELMDAYLADLEGTTKVASAMNLCFDKEKFDQLQTLYRTWQTEAKKEIAKASTNPPTRTSRTTYLLGRQLTSNVSSLLVRWMGKLGPDEEHAQILSILDPVLEVAILNAKQARAERMKQSNAKSTSTSNPNAGRNYFQLIYGKENFQATIDFPTANDYVDHATLLLLREVYEVFKRNDVVSDFPAYLRQRFDKASDDDKLYESFFLATVLWWAEEQDEAIELMVKASQSLTEDINFRFEMAAMREMRGDYEEALEIIEAIVARDQQLLQRKELMALQLAERLGDNDRAYAATERLFGLRLDTNTQLNLAQRMRRLGLHDMADAVLSRVERQAGNQTQSLSSLMMMYQGQGKTNEANQIAHMLLQRTNSPNASMTTSSRNPFRYRTSSDTTRKQALQVLQQSGELKKLVEKTEAQIARSPSSLRLVDQLIEFYTTLGDRAKTGELLEKAVEQKPDSVMMRYQLAKHLEATGKIKEACDQYLELIKQKPDWITEDLNAVRNVFTRAKRTLELAEAIKSINIKKISQPYYITNLVSSLMQEEKNSDAAIDLFEKVFEAFPTYRANMISNFHDPKIWSNDRIYQLGKRSIIPSESDVHSNPWFGVDQIRSYSGDGTANSMFQEMLNALSNSDKQADLRKSIEANIEKNPTWLGGKAMLALLDLKANRKAAGLKALQDLVDSETELKMIPSNACWILGQELDKSEQSRPLAMKLFEQAVSAHDNQMSNQIQYSPISRLIQLYTEMGRKEEGRDLLLKSLRANAFQNYDAQYASYQKIENSSWAANKLLDMGFPVDSIRLLREIADDSEASKAASQWNGRPPDYYSAQSRKSLDKAIASLDASNADEAVARLLQVNEKLQAEVAALDLMLSIPDIGSIQQKKMESGLINLFQSISQMDNLSDSKLENEKSNGKSESHRLIRQSVDDQLVKLIKENPTDLSVRIALAALRLRTNHEQADEAVQSLLTLLDEQPLDSIPEGRRANSRQRKEAALSVPLWIVARECLAKKGLEAAGQKLADRALVAARRQTGHQHTMAVLFDWAKLLLDGGDRPNAELKLAELLKIATERPQRKATTESPKTGMIPSSPAGNAAAIAAQVQLLKQGVRPNTNPNSKPDPRQAATSDATPPLTASQFKLTMAIATMAADHEMPELSRSAVREALVGGIPVPDVADGNAAGLGSSLAIRTVVTSSSRSANAADSNPMETLAASSVQTVIEKWKGDAYPATEVYDLLKPLVLPTSRPTEIAMYADSANLRDAKLKSLAEALVHWAKKANKLDALDSEVANRMKSPTTKVAGTVLQVLSAIAGDKAEKANMLLTDLADQAAKGLSPVLLQLACHAALPASDIPATQKPAFAILKKVLEQQTQAASEDPNSVASSVGKLAEKVNRYMADNGDAESVKNYFESILVARQPSYSRYSDGYGLYKQANDTALLASEAARVGMPSVALDFMGRATDYQVERYSRPNVRLPLTATLRQLRTQSAAERFKAWRLWTMPASDRLTIRLAFEFVSPTVAPTAFLKIHPANGPPLDTDLLCNWIELLDAARETGNLDKLKTEAQQAFDQKIPNADQLLALILIELGDVKTCQPIIEKCVSSYLERKKVVSTSSVTDYRAEYLLYRASRSSPEFADVYDKAIGKPGASTEDLRMPLYQSHVVLDYAKRKLDDHHATIQPGDDAGLKHWFSASTLTDSTTAKKPWWVVHENHLAHLSGVGTDLLYFKYPLQGEFEFSVDSYRGVNANGEAGYGGVIYQTQQSSALSLSGQELVPQSNSAQRVAQNFNRIQIASKNKQQQVLLNGQQVYSEANTETSPWLTLAALQTNMTTFRNLQIKGSPVIPREVALLHNDSMDGWNCSFFNESRPRKRLMAVKAVSQSDRNFYEQQREPTSFDWNATANVLVGESKSDAKESGQSWIYYHRPLQPEESFSYEFFYKPGDAVAHPTLGRIALLLDPSGVKEHWIAQVNWDDVVNGIPLDNAIVATECRKGPAVLPLKDNDWNAVKLTFKNDLAIVSLNGTVIYERPNDGQLDSRFGFFRYKNQSSKIRDAVLSGPWPEKLTPEILEDLLAVSTERSSVDRRAIHSILTDRIFEADIPYVVAKARSSQPKDAYDLLKNWVLPSNDHANFRLYYRYTPFAQRDTNQNASDEEMIDCPAFDLVARAAELNRLPSLLDDVKSIVPSGTIEQRNRNALLTLIGLEQGDQTAIREGLANLYAIDGKKIPKELDLRDRSAEYIVAWKVAENKQYWNPANELANALFKLERNKETTAGNIDWKLQLGMLVGRIAMLGEHRNESTPPVDTVLTQWHRIPYLKPEKRLEGHRPSEWLYQRGALEHASGGTWQQLFFQSPLRGKFEITAKHSMYQNRDMAMAYGMHSVELIKLTQSIGISKVMHGNYDIDRKIKDPNSADLSDFRVAVDGNKVTTWINGILVHEEKFAAPPDPWIVLQAKQPHFTSYLRDLRIVGTPEIPNEINLIDMAGWAGWRADIFNESHAGNGETPVKNAGKGKAKARAPAAGQIKNEPWQHSGDEIVGVLRKNTAVGPVESLLMYQRPVLEDGELEWEAFYAPGEVEVHPTIGRVAFMIHADGVRLHHLTEGLYDATGLATDNESPIEGAADKIELKENRWNQFKLAIVGDRLTLTINGNEAAQYTVTEAPTERYFGLFRYSNKTKSRIRNLVYRGAWPKSLPSVEQQQLAYPAGGPCQLQSASGFETAVFKLNDSLEAIQKAGFEVNGRADQFKVDETGIKIALRKSQTIDDRLLFQLPMNQEKDCEITLDYRDLALKAAKQGYGVAFALSVTMDDYEKSIVECSSKIGAGKEQNFAGALRRNSPTESLLAIETLQIPGSPSAGRLRLVRKSGSIYCLCADAGSEEFRLIQSFNVGEARISTLVIEAKSSDEVGQVDVTIEKLTVRTPKP
ncbi:MAG: DUF1583 domain-containing protein [Pirellulaceae bacterium]|nr:DUF1583 domain-containing protein [Pirellulaceae bacterium]